MAVYNNICIYGGFNDDRYTMFSLNDEYLIKVGDFKVEINGKEYQVYMINKGYNGQYYRITIDNCNYVSTNVWDGIDEEVKIKEYGTIQEIKKEDICETDIVLDTIDYLPDKISIIEQLKKQMMDDDEKRQRSELYWKNKSIILRLSDGTGEWGYKVLQVKLNNKYIYYWYNSIKFHESLDDYDYVTDSIDHLAHYILDRMKSAKQYETIEQLYTINTKSNDILKVLRKYYKIRKSPYKDDDHYVFRRVKKCVNNEC